MAGEIAIVRYLQLASLYSQPPLAPKEKITMHDEIYSDGISEVTVTGSIVRVDLVSLSPLEHDANNVPKKVFRQRLIFSVEAFANSVEVLQKAMQGLIQAGAIKRVLPKSTEAESNSAGKEHIVSMPIDNKTQRAPNVSKNFS
jgi:hypothetical protein